MANRLVRWLTYTVSFAFLPFIVSVIIRLLADKLSIVDIANSPEILFFSLMITATALGDLSEVTKPSNHTITFDLIRSSLLLGSLFSAILYGSFVFDSIANPTSSDFRIRLMKLSQWMAIAFFFISAIVESWIGQMKAQS